jgi:hypothetical protein
MKSATLRPLLVVLILAAIALWIGSPPQSPERAPASAAGDPSKTPPSWLVLRRGVRAFTGDDGGGATTLTICSSARLYNRWLLSTAVVSGCVSVPRGIPVTIGSEELIKDDRVEYVYFVFIKADKVSWSGWTGSLGLQPYIPANTRVVVHTAVLGGWTTLWPDRTAAGGGVDLRNGATLQIIRQDTKSGDLPGLYAQITGDSPDAGKKGWIFSLGLDVQGGGPMLFYPPSATEWR